MNAIKPVYDRKAKSYRVEEVADANPLYAHEGWLVYDDAGRAVEAIERGALLGHWTQAKRTAVLTVLRAAVEKEAAVYAELEAEGAADAELYSRWERGPGAR